MNKGYLCTVHIVEVLEYVIKMLVIYIFPILS
jgi:hypothetical protein